MRDTSAPEPGPWADLVEGALKGTWTGQKLTVTELAARVGVARQTASLWRTGRQIPDTALVVAKVAQVAGVELDVALRAAGLDVAESESGPREDDAAIRLIQGWDTRDSVKRELISYLREKRARDEEERLRQIETMLRASEGK